MRTAAPTPAAQEGERAAVLDPVTGASDRTANWRRMGWFGALLLCVVLASAGMPAQRGVVADGTHIEACHDLRVGSRGHGDARAIAPSCADIVAAVATPRPRARARTIEAGGLPPPRAPTA